LRNMEQRIESIDGQLTITSSSSGTCVVATVPLP
jgi:two-component system NarL family sensor kinase